jgi:hypothetical protein
VDLEMDGLREVAVPGPAQCSCAASGSGLSPRGSRTTSGAPPTGYRRSGRTLWPDRCLLALGALHPRASAIMSDREWRVNLVACPALPALASLHDPRPSLPPLFGPSPSWPSGRGGRGRGPPSWCCAVRWPCPWPGRGAALPARPAGPAPLRDPGARLLSWSPPRSMS